MNIGRHGWCLLAFSIIAFVANIANAMTTASSESNPRLIIVAVADKPASAPSAGSTPRGYAGLQNYAGSDRAIATAANVAHDYDLREVSAWTIESLRLRCMLFEIPAAADRETIFTRLHKDDRVRLVQPLQDFDTYTTAPDAGGSTNMPEPTAYNDPYVGLQHGFTAIGAAAAQRWSNGGGIRVALIDTGVDAMHQDLAGRIELQRDFVTGSSSAANADRHGTEVAGVIAAVANNGLGIVGVAPAARILSYRACWPAQGGASAARCNTFTLAQALGAAIASGAPIINLSLGGPSDPLLEELLGYAIKRGAIVVGAVPPGGRMDGFPINVKGVIAVSSSEDAQPTGVVLAAPGRDILTLEPGGHYDYASGSSLATAYVSGAVALLLVLDHHLDAPALLGLLQKSQRDGNTPINICEAISALRRSGGNYATTPVHAE
ncbi:S8 family peptidase [Pseudolysobacter antarcticus]|nr:S8 family serine peptidase [Pseudolysobacter antarcticus]